jgi:N-acyl amino acid synthase of PEP-CTERM/exosortase system
LEVTDIMFDDRFEAILADTSQARRIHYRIRFLVYCLETGYEDPAAHPDGLECDQWDESSVHFLVRRRDNGAWIAAMRLVLPGERKLPVESICRLDENVTAGIGAGKVAEVSRLCMVEHYRRRSAEHDMPYEFVDSDPGRRQEALPFAIEKRSGQRRHSSEIMLGLLRAGAEFSRGLGLTHWYFLTTPVLRRIVERYGIPLTPAGQAQPFRGERRPYLVDLSRACDALRSGDARMSTWLESGKALRPYSALTGPGGIPDLPAAGHEHLRIAESVA